jgi:integrase
MPARRAYGSGSIRQRPDGLFEGTLSLGRVAGQRARRSVYGKTRREVAEKLAALRRQHATGQSLTMGRELAPAYLARWLADVIAIQRPARTLQTYQGHVTRYLAPALSGKRLADVTAADLQALYARLSRGGLAPATIRLTHAVAHAAFKHALRTDLIARNPADHATAPAPVRTVRPTLTAAQAQTLLAAVAGDELEALWFLLLLTGLRIGEALRLEWRAVDLARATLSVRAAKTPRGRRLIPLAPPLLARLQAQRARTAAVRSPFVYPRPDGQPWSDTTIRAQRWYPLLERLALPRVRLHDIRHGVATLLLEMGVHPAVVQQVLGHANVGVTLDTYSHVSESMSRAALEQLATLLTAAPGASEMGSPGEHDSTNGGSRGGDDDENRASICPDGVSALS